MFRANSLKTHTHTHHTKWWKRGKYLKCLCLRCVCRRRTFTNIEQNIRNICSGIYWISQDICMCVDVWKICLAGSIVKAKITFMCKQHRCCILLQSEWNWKFPFYLYLGFGLSIAQRMVDIVEMGENYEMLMRFLETQFLKTCQHCLL